MIAFFETLKSLLVVALRFAIAYALFFYLAHFTEIQSVVLAVVGLCAFDAYRSAFRTAMKQKPDFEPFWVTIQPNWYSLCQDFHLADVEKWQDLLKQWQRPASSEYSILHDGVTFTMLSKKLFYSNNYQNFFGELDLKIPVEELKPESGTFGRPFTPQLYIKRSLAGEKRTLPVIEFGLVTEESLKRGFHPADEKANLPFAQLPEVIFYNYFNSELNGEVDYDQAKRWEKEGQMRLVEYGWTQKERDPEDSWLNWPYEISHKYLRVTYRGIS